MMNQVYKTLPDDRPITSLIIVEDVEKCPPGYVPIFKTYDQDSDADLWKESGFFGKKCTRYLCLSKTEGTQGYLIHSLIVINEKETPPDGYKTIPKTYDSKVKSWRKRQLCYRNAPISSTETAITDVIVLGRMKKAPEGFVSLGEINGALLCCKYGRNNLLYPQIPYSPFSTAKTSDNSVHGNENYPFESSKNNKGIGGEEQRLNILRPFRPAPNPPASSYATISGYTGLEGVPFILNPRFVFGGKSIKDFPSLKLKSRAQINEEYSYEFVTEYEI